MSRQVTCMSTLGLRVWCAAVSPRYWPRETAASETLQPSQVSALGRIESPDGIAKGGLLNAICNDTIRVLPEKEEQVSPVA